MALQHTNHDRAANLATRVVAEQLREPVLGVRPIVGFGSQNMVYVVTTTHQQVVVRMSAEPSALDRYRKERWCIEHAAARGVPGPTALAVGDVEQHAYMIQTFDPGQHVDACADAQTHVWRQLGRFSRNIHGIAVCGFGDQLSDITPGNAARTWLGSVRYNIEQLRDTDPLRRMGVLTDAQSALLRATFEALANRQFRFGLCHGDLALHNVLVDATGTVRLLDWGCAEAHIVPHYDLIRMTEWKNVEAPALSAFLEGYGIDPKAFEALRADLADLTVLKAIDLTRWAIDRMPSAIDAHAARARRIVRAYVALSG